MIYYSNKNYKNSLKIFLELIIKRKKLISNEDIIPLQFSLNYYVCHFIYNFI